MAAYAMTPPRHLGPTVGQSALSRVKFRMGNVLPSGEKVVTGLVQRFGLLDFVSDNAGCFGSAPMPRNGRIMLFGSHKVYVATTHVYKYPEKILVAADPPSVFWIKGKHPLRAAVWQRSW